MSVKVMSWVFDHSESTGNERLVMLAIADHADDETWEAYPSIERLAKKAHVSVRTVQRSIRHLAEVGELRIVDGGGRRSHTYTILRSPQGCQSDTSRSVSPVTNDSSGVPHSASRGDTADTRTTKNRHREPRICEDVGCPDCHGSGQRADGFACWKDAA